MEGRDKTLAWVPHKSESETMVYGWGGHLLESVGCGGKIERRRTETGKESVIFLPSSLPAFHSVLTVVGDWTLGPIQEPFNTLLTKDLLIHLLLPKRY